MSKEDVLKALEEIKNSYAPITIDVTPTEENENASNRNKARGRLLQASEGSDAEIESEISSDED
jgi:hypothetical protein